MEQDVEAAQAAPQRDPATREGAPRAYGELGAVLAGQYWTLFMPLESYPGTVDFQGPAGIPFMRQAQLRFTADLGDGLTLAGSLENSDFNGRASDDAVRLQTAVPFNF